MQTMRMTRLWLIVPGVASGRLATDEHGRQVVVATTAAVDVRVGDVWVILGNVLPAAEAGVYWLGQDRGRRASAKEQAEARAPYRAPVLAPAPADELPDEALAEQEAIRLARLEQQREPLCLLDAA